MGAVEAEGEPGERVCVPGHVEVHRRVQLVDRQVEDHRRAVPVVHVVLDLGLGSEEIVVHSILLI